jgi:hypothetical protein
VSMQGGPADPLATPSARCQEGGACISNEASTHLQKTWPGPHRDILAQIVDACVSPGIERTA